MVVVVVAVVVTVVVVVVDREHQNGAQGIIWFQPLSSLLFYSSNNE